MFGAQCEPYERCGVREVRLLGEHDEDVVVSALRSVGRVPLPVIA